MNIAIKDLLDAGVHFGHQMRRFNPKSKKFVFGNRHGISIIDLEKTFAQLEKATRFTEDLVAEGKQILLVGTKRQAQEILREAATTCQQPYAVSRWLGGTLTNFSTVTRSMQKYRKYLSWEQSGELDKLPNKEAAAIRREMTRMRRNFEGLLDMNDMPGALFIVDTHHESIAVAEANRLKIPVVALVDTNSDPSKVQFPVPGNDDSIKSIRLIVETIMDAIQAGLARRDVPDAIQMRDLTPVAGAQTTEEQVPVTRRARTEEGDEVPQTFSSDADG